jgi:hypothetical protein
VGESLSPHEPPLCGAFLVVERRSANSAYAAGFEGCYYTIPAVCWPYVTLDRDRDAVRLPTAVPANALHCSIALLHWNAAVPWVQDTP